MDSDVDALKEWITEYIRHKDIFLKSIKEIKQDEKGIGIAVYYKNKKQLIIVEPILSSMEPIIEKIKKSEDEYESLILVVFNTKSNLNKIIEYWNKLALISKLNIYFVNPDSETDKRWIISPYTHSMVTNPSSLKTGLMSLFSIVDEVKGKDK